MKHHEKGHIAKESQAMAMAAGVMLALLLPKAHPHSLPAKIAMGVCTWVILWNLRYLLIPVYRLEDPEPRSPWDTLLFLLLAVAIVGIAVAFIFFYKGHP